MNADYLTKGLQQIKFEANRKRVQGWQRESYAHSAYFIYIHITHSQSSSHHKYCYEKESWCWQCDSHDQSKIESNYVSFHFNVCLFISFTLCVLWERSFSQFSENGLHVLSLHLIVSRSLIHQCKRWSCIELDLCRSQHQFINAYVKVIISMFVALKGTEVLRVQTLRNMSYTLFVAVHFHFTFISKFIRWAHNPKWH